MNSRNCNRCGRLRAADCPLCPYCGALQDEPARGTIHREQHDAWLVLLPAVVGPFAGYLASESAWGAGAGLVAGLFVGLGLLAARYARQPRT